MRNLTEHNLTDAVLGRVAPTTEERTRFLHDALVRHLHAFVRETELTEAEWATAIEFLTATGHMCTGKRQEFILLSDVLGVSMLVDAINHRRPSATESTVFGPFYVQDAPSAKLGEDISAGMPGAPLYVYGTVSDTSGRPVPGATIDVWGVDAGGFYDVQHGDDAPLRGRARLTASEDGRFDFWTVAPVSYPIPTDGPVGRVLGALGRHPFRPAHVHFMVSKPEFSKLITHLFVEGDPYLDSDAVFGVKNSLVIAFEQQPPGRAPDGREMAVPYSVAHYDFVLSRA